MVGSWSDPWQSLSTNGKTANGGSLQAQGGMRCRGEPASSFLRVCVRCSSAVGGKWGFAVVCYARWDVGDGGFAER